MARRTFICPYCFEENFIQDIEFRCTNRRCVDVDDVPMTKYENGNIKIPKKGKPTFKPSKSSGHNVRESEYCPECNNLSYKHICPTCHNELPESTLYGEDMIISVVGSRATGKSHFVGVIIKELRDRIAPSFNGSLEGFADSYHRWEYNFGDRLYNANEKLDLTKSSLVNVDNGAYRPLIFKFKIKTQGFLKEKIKSFTFVFFDTAGEDLNDEDTMSTVNKYICKSSGIIFLLDPMQIPAVSSQIDKDIVSTASGIDWRQAAKSDDIMTRVSKLIRNDKGLRDVDKINIPVAAVFSKFDAIESIVPDDCTVNKPSPHCQLGKFDSKDWNNVHNEIISLLKEWDSEAFISQLETNYTTSSFFSASSLGLNNNPKPNGSINRPNPHRIEDPLLWILKINNVIS